MTDGGGRWWLIIAGGSQRWLATAVDNGNWWWTLVDNDDGRLIRSMKKERIDRKRKETSRKR